MPDQEYALAKSEWSFKTAVELSAALTAKKVSAVELAQDAINRIERHDARINAICVRDFERGLAAARAADAALARGEKKPLLGIPMTVRNPTMSRACRRRGAFRRRRILRRPKTRFRSAASRTPAA
jgi:Amidase